MSRRLLFVSLGLLALSPGAHALTFTATAQAQVPGHAAGTFGQPGDPGGPSGGLAWAPDGSAYSLDGARVLYHWETRSGRPLSRRVVQVPASLPGVAQGVGPRLWLEGYRSAGPLRGPFVRVVGERQGQPYQSAFTLRADGQGVVGDVCGGSRERPAACSGVDGRFAAAVERTDGGRATLLAGPREGRPVRRTLPAGRVVALEPSPDGRFVAVLRETRQTPGFDLNARFWLDLVPLSEEEAPVRSRTVGVRVQADDSRPEVHWAGQNRLLTATSALDPNSGGARAHTVQLWDLDRPRPLWTLGDTETLRGAVPSPDGRLFLTVRGGSVPEVHRISDGRFVRALGTAVTAFTPLRGQRTLVSVDIGNGAAELRVVSGPGQGVRLGRTRDGQVTYLAATPDERHLALARDGAVELVDHLGRPLRRQVVGRTPNELAFTADGQVLFAVFPPQGTTGGWQALAWNIRTGQRLALPARTRPLRADLWVQEQAGQGRTRLRALTPAGRVLWQEGWRPAGSAAWHPSLDARALVRVTPQALPSQLEQVAAALHRVDAVSGAISPGVVLRPAGTSPYRGLKLLGVAPDRRHALLSESEGDGCGATFHGLRLADLAGRREVPLPAGLSAALRRESGCGSPVPFPEAAFVPGTGAGAPGLLVRDGNSLNWWLGKR
ncbi:WD40 repeat domain-containing protein [Deinococcus hohokamensis]|uniref:WD40 repeat domain-containing protein n=1 Tax=Deinococcus hohokamensis TaxID=309883 RepID=A0ABV9I813_9DEIO